MICQAIQCKPAKFGKVVKIQEADNQITMGPPHSQPVLDFCPSQNKHFFVEWQRSWAITFAPSEHLREQSRFSGFEGSA